MAVPIVYKSDDVDAPVLNGVAGSMANLLTKCLVVGYGGKVAAGWSKEFENGDNTIISIRNNPVTGTGFFLQVTDTDAAYCAMQGYETMSAFDVGIGQFLLDNVSWNKSKEAGTIGRHWAIIATDTFFHFLVYPDSTTTAEIIISSTAANVGGISWGFFGDFIKANDEGFNCILGYGEIPTSGFGPTGGTPTKALFPNVKFGSNAYGAAGAPRPLSATPNTPTNIGITTSGGPVTMFNSGYCSTNIGPEYTGDNLFIARRSLFDEATSNFRGCLPGHFQGCHHYEGFSDLALKTITHDGRSFICAVFRYVYSISPTHKNYNSQGIFLIEIGAEW